MFEIKNVTKQYGGEFALREVSLSIGKGLNFIIGASGSGKTTLLKIISGMEPSFDGEVYYCGQSIKTLTEKEKSYFYNNIFGFIWQDFNLLEDLTVLENVMLPKHLKEKQDKKDVLRVLRELKISELANIKVSKLSGGQKQRVAIARELIKNPQVIIADEPTSALDEKASKTTLEILREISKTRTVIIVTHDTSLIDAKSKVYELDKGELFSYPDETLVKTKGLEKKEAHSLSFKNACALARINLKSKWGRFATTAISLLIAATLLLVTVSGAITDSGQEAFEDLYTTYGGGILDVSVVGSFTSAGGSNGSENDEPNANVTQDIGGLYDKFVTDSRVEHIVFTQAFNDIKVTIDGKDYEVQSSSSVPVVNKLTAGVMPMGNGNEVVVPNSFVKKLGITEEQAIGKELDFHAAIFNWDSGEPVLMPVTTTAKIVGVVDTTVKYEYEGQVMELSVDDSFFFSKVTLDEMRAQAKIEKSEINFVVRANTPEDMIAIKDELNAEGIVPLGRFELVEDMVRLNEQTTEQSSSAIAVIGFLSVLVVIATATITAIMRKREYAIYKVSGYSKGHLINMISTEFIITTMISIMLFLVCSPLFNLATTSFWDVTILTAKLLATGVALVFLMGVVSCVIMGIIGANTKAMNSLKTGER